AKVPTTAYSYSTGWPSGGMRQTRIKDIPPAEFRPVEALNLPPSQPGEAAALGGKPRKVQDLTVTDLSLPAGQIAPCLCWAADGRSFYVLESSPLAVPSTTLRRISFPDLTEQRRWTVNYRISWLARSAAGLLLTVPTLEEVWVVDPEALALLQRINVP